MYAYDFLTILGPTASGKTHLAVHLARALNGEVISGDSRQVYRDMNIGTGKDLNEYVEDGASIPIHLVDIAEPGEKYNVYHYQRDFLEAYQKVKRTGRLPILCGGSGLYVESVLRGYRLLPVPENPALREQLQGKSLEELTQILSRYKKLHNTTDTDTPKRAIRGIEIEEYYHNLSSEERSFPSLRSVVFGIFVDRDERRRLIDERLSARFKEGMIEEVQNLLLRGVKAEDLIYYGLEYKYITLYLVGKLTREEMMEQLRIAIHQFAKRQMTWFRGMERRGISIHWLDYRTPLDEKIRQVCKVIQYR